MKNKFIDLHEYKINPVEHYKVKPSKKKLALAAGLASTSFILPDASLGIMAAGVALSPLPFKRALKNKYTNVKRGAIKKWYQMK